MSHCVCVEHARPLEVPARVTHTHTNDESTLVSDTVTGNQSSCNRCSNKKETRTIAVDTLHVAAAVETTQLAILGFVDDQSTFVTQGLHLSSQSNSSKSVQT